MKNDSERDKKNTRRGEKKKIRDERIREKKEDKKWEKGNRRKGIKMMRGKDNAVFAFVVIAIKKKRKKIKPRK